MVLKAFHFLKSKNMAITDATNMIPTNATRGIHSGDIIHHQLQSITFVSFNTRKIMNVIVGMSVPVLACCIR